VFEMITNNDEDAIKAFDQITSYLAGAIYNFNCILNPKKVLLGGGISKQPLLKETINKKVNDIYASIPFNIPHTIIETTKFFNDSNLIGALANYNIMFK
ncbi:MAG: ROK family protein, partial [Agathobacter sp.]